MKIKGQEVVVSVAVCHRGTTDIIDEYDTLGEARKEYGNGYDYWYLAAEVINEDGDTNPSCWGRTRQEAIGRLKKAL